MSNNSKKTKLDYYFVLLLYFIDHFYKFTYFLDNLSNFIKKK